MPRQLIQASKMEMARAFGKQWTHKGLAIFMDDTHYQFASDWANVLITSFVEQQAAQAAKPKVALTDADASDTSNVPPSGGTL